MCNQKNILGANATTSRPALLPLDSAFLPQLFYLYLWTTKAEVIWTLRLIEGHFSYRSCDKDVGAFKLMFPNEPIVRKMQLAKSKIDYVILFGLAPYFRKLCIDKVQKAEEFVICFDESFNKQLKQGQMDLLVRLWNNETDKSGGVLFNF